MKIVIIIFLFIAYLGLFLLLKRAELIKRVLMYTEEYVTKGSRKRLLNNRQALVDMQTGFSPLRYMDKLLTYGGIYRKFPGINLELVIVFEVCLLSFMFVVTLALARDAFKAFLIVASIVGIEYVYLFMERLKNLNQVEMELMKFLDFCGNYGATAGELTAIFSSISVYMEEPLCSVLNECFYEAQTTGDMSLALLSMNEKIEHKQFKEIIRNLEIGSRYSADFKVLLQDSKKSTREFIRAGSENRSVILEASINMLILLILSIAIMLIVENMAEVSIMIILFSTLPGKIAVGIYVSIFFMFVKQLYNVRN